MSFHILPLLNSTAAMDSMETHKQGKPNRKTSIFFLLSAGNFVKEVQ
jgi:hypothetical protein